VRAVLDPDPPDDRLITVIAAEVGDSFTHELDIEQKIKTIDCDELAIVLKKN